MTLYYVAFSEIPSERANAIQVLRMCEAFAGLVDRVELFCRAGRMTTEALTSFYGIGRPFVTHPVNVPRVRVLNRLWYAVVVVMALIRRDDASLVYSRDVFTSWALCVTGPDNLRLIFEAHAPPETRTRRWLLGRVLKNRKFLRLVVISGALADEFRRLYPGLGDDRIIVAHDGASEPVPAERTEAAFRDSSRTSVGYVGSLRPGKGMEIIHALAPLLPQCDFHVVGGDEGAVRDWKQRTSSPNVTFHGFVSPAEAQRRIKDFDVVLAPYQPVVLVGDGDLDIGRWMSPLKLFEYMSHGKPILASDLPVLREVLMDGNNALLADPLDVTDWGRKLAQLAADAAMRARLGAAALRDLRGNYTWDRRAASILDKAGVTERRESNAGPA